MIATMYKRRMKAAFALSSIVMLIGISVFFIDRPDSLQNWLNLSSIGIVGLFLFFTGVSNQIKYNKVKDIQIHESKASLLELDHLVLKKDLGFFLVSYCLKKAAILLERLSQSVFLLFFTQ